MNLKAAIPHFFTLINLCCGVGIILLSLSERLPYKHQSIYIALISIALLADLLDGWIARKLNVQSKLGGELDSFADFVTFGIAPTLLLFFGSDFFMAHIHPVAIGLVAMVIISCSVIRLAQFNLITTTPNYFLGLPTPAHAFWLYAITFYLNSETAISKNKAIIILCVCVVLSILLVAKTPMYSLKMNIKAHAVPLGLILLLGITSTVLLNWLGVALSVLIYIFISILFKNKIIHREQKIS